ncbi:hypothetical protein [Marivirga lumbricoides]
MKITFKSNEVHSEKCIGLATKGVISNLLDIEVKEAEISTIHFSVSAVDSDNEIVWIDENINEPFEILINNHSPINDLSEPLKISSRKEETEIQKKLELYEKLREELSIKNLI